MRNDSILPQSAPMGDHIFSPAVLDWLAGELAERLAGRISSGAGDEIGDVYDAAQWLGCSVPTVERAVKRGEVPSIKVGRLRRYRRADLMGLSMGGRADG